MAKKSTKSTAKKTIQIKIERNPEKFPELEKLIDDLEYLSNRSDYVINPIVDCAIYSFAIMKITKFLTENFDICTIDAVKITKDCIGDYLVGGSSCPFEEECDHE